MKNINKVSVSIVLVLIVLIALIVTGSKLGKIGSALRSQSTAAAVTADLLTANNFAVLAGSGITNIGSTNVTGDIGSYPTLTQNGFGPGVDSVTILGTNHNGDAVTQTAKDDLVTAYNTAMGQTPTGTIAADLGGQTLTPGVYKDNGAPDSLGISGTLTLDAGNDPNAVFIFQSASTLVTASGSTVNLVNGAQACNVVWQVGSSATLGTNSTFVGNILASDSITDNGGSTVAGRLLARNAAVTLNNTHVYVPTCTTTPPPLAAPELTLIKVVVNGNGGTKVVSDFPLFIDGSPVVSGTLNTSTVGLHTVSETSDLGYTSAITGDCATDGTITLALGDVKICTITNSYITQQVSSGGGSSSGGGYIAPPLISVIKVPSPLALPNGPGLVTYTYTLHNIGTVPVNNLTMNDDSCNPVTFISGDTNGDSKLDLNETWTYRCATTLSTTHTNTVTATGWANGISTTDLASATVVVGVSTVPPLIHVTKIPNPLALLAGEGTVNYTETITNPGIVALSNVNLSDDKCSPMKYVSGDINGNSKLDTNESWKYTCQSFLAKTTTNTATATGEADGLTARDFAIATVVVSVPGLPKTGFPPKGK